MSKRVDKHRIKEIELFEQKAAASVEGRHCCVVLRVAVRDAPTTAVHGQPINSGERGKNPGTVREGQCTNNGGGTWKRKKVTPDGSAFVVSEYLVLVAIFKKALVLSTA